MTAVSARQIGAIHAIAKRLKLDDDVRRDLIERETGKRSSRELTFAEAGRVIECLKVLSTPSQMAVDNHSNGALRLDGPYAGKLRALWISAWNLGVTRERTDQALLAFVARQTGLSHTRFLREPREAAKAIEGLKAWLARVAGVTWPPAHAPIAEVKRAVIAAQLRLIGENDTGIAALPDAMLDEAAQTLGRKLRKRGIARPQPQEAGHAAHA